MINCVRTWFKMGSFPKVEPPTQTIHIHVSCISILLDCAVAQKMVAIGGPCRINLGILGNCIKSPVLC